MTNKEAFAVMAHIMDKRDKYFELLEAFYIKNGFVPESEKESFAIGKAEKFKPWRAQRGVYKRILKASRKASKMKDLDYMNSEQRTKYLEELIK